MSRRRHTEGPLKGRFMTKAEIAAAEGLVTPTTPVIPVSSNDRLVSQIEDALEKLCGPQPDDEPTEEIASVFGEAEATPEQIRFYEALDKQPAHEYTIPAPKQPFDDLDIPKFLRHPRQISPMPQAYTPNLPRRRPLMDFPWIRSVIDIGGAFCLAVALGIYGFFIYLGARYAIPKLLAFAASL